MQFNDSILITLMIYNQFTVSCNMKTGLLFCVQTTWKFVTCLPDFINYRDYKISSWPAYCRDNEYVSDKEQLA